MTIHAAQVGMLATNCYVVETEEKNAIIIDPGSNGREIGEWIKGMGLIPKMILLTHAHHDHIGGVAGLLEIFPDLPIYMGPEDESVISLSADRMGIRDSSDIVSSKAQIVEDGQEIKIDEIIFKVMYTPGHTSGGAIYILGAHIFCGDTVFREEIGRCDLPTGDYSVMLETLAKIAALPDDYNMYPGHGETTTLEHERKNNPYMRDLV